MRQIGSRAYPAAIFIYKDDETLEGAWSDVLTIARESGPICGEAHTEKESLLRALSDWNAATDPQSSFLCIYAHASDLGINSKSGRAETRITWQELAKTLQKPVRYLWLVGCATRSSANIWQPFHGPVGHLLLATTESAPFRPIVGCFASEIDVNNIAYDGEMFGILRRQNPELAEKTDFFKPAIVDGKPCFIKAFPESELKIRRFVDGPPFAPGFYDLLQFAEAERNNTLSGNDYAQYVEQRHYSTTEEEYSRKVVHAASRFIAIHLGKLPQMGGCIPISFLLSRLLEECGVWNYVTVGGVVVRFPPPIEPKVFYPDPALSGGMYGHAWVRVPPFQIVDLSLPYQAYSEAQSKVAIEPIISERPNRCPIPFEFSEYAESGIREWHGPHLVMHEGLELSYVPYAIMLPSETLELMKNPQFDGLAPHKLVEQFRKEYPTFKR